MTLKLYGKAPLSPNTIRVLVVLKEKKIPYEFIDVARSETRTPEYLSKSPFGLFPFIDDDGLILFESRAICRYIEAKYADREPKLIPTDSVANALFEQSASIESTTFEPLAVGVFNEMVRKPFFGESGNKDLFNSHIESLAAKLDAYDAILGKQKYIAGDELTLVDLFHLPLGVLLGIAGSDVMFSRPNVARWFNDLISRESWLTHNENLKKWKAVANSVCHASQDPSKFQSVMSSNNLVVV
ncbi:glutathione S-transferase [Tricholoma matsutake]|nr:glutathione S-transferase [Tricholoma matsutake 945]